MVPDPSTEIFPQVRTPKQRAVLQAYATTGQIQTACAAVGVPRSTHYHWLKTDPAYEAACAGFREPFVQYFRWRVSDASLRR